MSVAPSRAGMLLGGRREPQPLQSFRAGRAITRAAPALLFAALVIGLWQLYVASSGISASFLPSPLEVARALSNDRAALLSAAWTTLSEILLGYAAAIIVGVGLALLVASSRVVERAIYPWLVISQLVPIPAFAVVLVIWIGFDIFPKVIVIALVSFFAIAVNTIDGLRATDPQLLDLLRTFGAGRWQRMRIAQVPSALPYLFSGMRVAAALAVIGAVFAEWVGSSNGLGYLILTYGNQTETAKVFAAVVALAVIGVGLFAAVGIVERLALPWYRAGRYDERDAR